MQFDSNHKVKHELLTDREEARAFIDFLEKESIRHEREADLAEGYISGHRDTPIPYAKAMVELWESQVIRHNEDIESIKTSIKEVKDRLGL